MNPEIIKLVVILGGGIGILAVGGFLQHKKHKKIAKEDPSASSDTGSHNDNPQIKNYILSYKTQYERDEIREGLIGAGFSESEVDDHLSRYL